MSGLDRFGRVGARPSTADAKRLVASAGPQGIIGRARNRILKRAIDTVGITTANSGTAATVTIDASSPFGRPALRVALPSGNTWSEIQLTGLNIANFDGHVIWRVWVEDYAKIAQMSLYAGTPGYGRFWQQNHVINSSNPYLFNGEFPFPVGARFAAQSNTFVAGSDSLSDTKLRVFPVAGQVTNVWVDAVIVPGVGRPTHLITHDDASVTWLNNAIPVLAEHGLRATFAVNTADLGSNNNIFLSPSHISLIGSYGHQISSHNLANTSFNDGTGGTQTAAQYTADFMAAANVLSGLVGQSFDGGYTAWVQGRSRQDLHDTMRAAGIRIARGVLSPGYEFPQVGLGQRTLSLRAHSLHTLSPSQIDDICDAAIRYGLTCVWMVHEITEAGGVGVETSRSVYNHLVRRIGSDVDASLAANRTMGEFASELYAERLVSMSLLA